MTVIELRRMSVFSLEFFPGKLVDKCFPDFSDSACLPAGFLVGSGLLVQDPDSTVKQVFRAGAVSEET